MFTIIYYLTIYLSTKCDITCDILKKATILESTNKEYGISKMYEERYRDRHTGPFIIIFIDSKTSFKHESLSTVL